ncbi:MAG: hypothetical protein WCR30_01850 [Clostridia bacterium]
MALENIRIKLGSKEKGENLIIIYENATNYDLKLAFEAIKSRIEAKDQATSVLMQLNSPVIPPFLFKDIKMKNLYAHDCMFVAQNAFINSSVETMNFYRLRYLPSDIDKVENLQYIRLNGNYYHKGTKTIYEQWYRDYGSKNRLDRLINCYPEYSKFFKLCSPYYEKEFTK